MQAFEALSEIRVNLNKTEMFAINADNIQHFAYILQSEFFIKYLGLPFHGS